MSHMARVQTSLIYGLANVISFVVSLFLGASDMLILCLELIRGRLGVMSAEIRKLFFIILTTLIEKSPVSTPIVLRFLQILLTLVDCQIVSE